MRRLTLLLLLGALALPGCARLADSRLNPANWFGRALPAAAAAGQPLRPLVPEGRRRIVTDLRLPVEQVTEIALEPTLDGAILRATGLAAGAGFFNAQLVRRGFTDGVLTYEFRAEAPPGGPQPGNREITVATTIRAADLAAVRVIRVEALRGARELRR